MATYFDVNMFCLLLIFSLTFVSSFDDEFEGLQSLPVDHSFQSSPDSAFTRRGSIIIRSFKMNKAHFSPAGQLTPQEKEVLKSAAERNDFYRIKIPVRPVGSAHEEESQKYVSTFILACQLYESGLSDLLTLNVDQSGVIVGVSMSSTVGQCMDVTMPDDAISYWNTTIEIVQTVTGPLPETQLYIDKLKREEHDKQKGQQGDNRSFFAKYWMYIVPFVIVLMLASNSDPQGGGGGGGR
ncbi:ER membrane protein complex subunit 10 isoform X1 [Octopus bimaculoides]|uniref:ER membrane protein complex subunit 10 isoform X1 n=1 Tax=Octopus bimaculoides TaxID=37653 RepID=UPI00071DE345|nr:ER membrane protein complex subunit 10 isoform X1 [Octopus bimaculoides]|eukprot:XP_014775399.1 PREDICTED: ER membrane protein complex subunit 10-like [Octopus bimaculoides]